MRMGHRKGPKEIPGFVIEFKINLSVFMVNENPLSLWCEVFQRNSDFYYIFIR